MGDILFSGLAGALDAIATYDCMGMEPGWEERSVLNLYDTMATKGRVTDFIYIAVEAFNEEVPQERRLENDADAAVSRKDGR